MFLNKWRKLFNTRLLGKESNKFIFVIYRTIINNARVCFYYFRYMYIHIRKCIMQTRTCILCGYPLFKKIKKFKKTTDELLSQFILPNHFWDGASAVARSGCKEDSEPQALPKQAHDEEELPVCPPRHFLAVPNNNHLLYPTFNPPRLN